MQPRAALSAPAVICQEPPSGWQFDGKPQADFVTYRRAIPADHASANVNGGGNAFRARWYRVTWQEGIATSQAGGGFIRRHDTLAAAFAYVDSLLGGVAP